MALERIKFISILILSVLVASLPLMSSYALSVTTQDTAVACCIQEMGMDGMSQISTLAPCDMEELVRMNDNQRSENDSDGCKDCNHDCSDTTCHSIVPTLASLEVPPLQKGASFMPFPTEITSNYSNQENIYIDDFAHSIWHPPKV